MKTRAFPMTAQRQTRHRGETVQPLHSAVRHAFAAPTNCETKEDWRYQTLLTVSSKHWARMSHNQQNPPPRLAPGGPLAALPTAREQGLRCSGSIWTPPFSSVAANTSRYKSPLFGDEQSSASDQNLQFSAWSDQTESSRAEPILLCPPVCT